jgi:hypothetical protein
MKKSELVSDILACTLEVIQRIDQQYVSTVYICLYKFISRRDRAINVAFCCKMNNSTGVMRIKDFTHRLTIRNINILICQIFMRRVIYRGFDRRVSHAINIDNVFLSLLKPI